MWYKVFLQMIATVDKNYGHNIELDALIYLLENSKVHYSVTGEQWQRLITLARNTYWSHYRSADPVDETVYTELEKLEKE